MFNQFGILLISLGIICLSGVADARGFFHAARVWDGGIVWTELGKSALGFNLGFLAYVVSLKYLKQFGVISPEIQTLTWFGVTLVLLALLNGSFLKWDFANQGVGVMVFIGIGWLLFNSH